MQEWEEECIQRPHEGSQPPQDTLCILTYHFLSSIFCLQ